MFVLKENFDEKYVKDAKELFTEVSEDLVECDQTKLYKQKLEQFLTLRRNRIIASKLFENGISLFIRLHCYRNGEGEKIFLMIKANRKSKMLLSFEIEEFDLLIKNWLLKIKNETNYLLFLIERFCITEEKLPKPKTVIKVSQQYWFSPIV